MMCVSVYFYFSVSSGTTFLLVRMYVPRRQHGGGDKMSVQHNARPQRHKCSCGDRHTDHKTLLRVSIIIFGLGGLHNYAIYSRRHYTWALIYSRRYDFCARNEHTHTKIKSTRQFGPISDPQFQKSRKWPGNINYTMWKYGGDVLWPPWALAPAI